MLNQVAVNIDEDDDDDDLEMEAGFAANERGQ
jgi:hypothetical protein